MKKKLLSILFTLVLMLSMSLATATPAVAGEIPVGVTTGEWSTEAPQVGAYSYHVVLPSDSSEGGLDIIQTVTSTITLADLTAMTFWERVEVAGGSHDLGAGVTLYMDMNGDGDFDWGNDAQIVLESPYDSELVLGNIGVWALRDIADFAGFQKGGGALGLPFTGADGVTLENSPLAEWQASPYAMYPLLSVGIVVGWGDYGDYDGYFDDFVINGDVYALEPGVINTDTGEGFSTIQAAVDAATDGDTISVAAGTYNEQVFVYKSLTLQGAGSTTIIQPSGPALISTTIIPWIGGLSTMSAIVFVETAGGGEVTIQDLEIDGSLITSKTTTWMAGLVYLETGGLVEGVTVNGGSTLPDRTAGIFAAAITESVSLEVTGCTVEVYTRAGIYALGETITANYHHNEINGPGDTETGVPNGVFFLEGANGSVTYTVVTDLGYTGEEYRSTGIGTYNAGTDVTFAYNTVSNVQNAFALSTGTSGTVVEHNEAFNNHTGVRIEAGAMNSVIQHNDIHDNDFAMRLGPEMGEGNEAHFNSFVDNSGLEWTNVGEGCTYIGAVCNLYSAVFDATNNWWGQSSGPGDAISLNVDAEPWLLAEGGEPYDRTVSLNPGWTIVSPDAELADWDIVDSVGLMYAYGWDETHECMGFIQATDLDPISPISPVFILTADGGGVGFNHAEDSMGLFTTNLEAGWNLIGVPETNYDPYEILAHLLYGANNEAALATLVSQGVYNPSGESFYQPTLSTNDWTSLAGETLYPFDGYWAYMNVAKEFGVVVVE